jgi:hypothetical protein
VVDFSAPASGRPIMAFKQAQALGLQMTQGVILGRITHGFGGAGCAT